MAETLHRKVLSAEEVDDFIGHLRTLPREDQVFDFEVRQNRIRADGVAIPYWRARYKDLSPEDQKRLARVERVHAQEIQIHELIGPCIWFD
jgi:hypothetical protein